MKNNRLKESGRTLLEMVAVMAIMGIIAIAAVKGYDSMVSEVKAHNTAKMVKTLAFERQIDRSSGQRTIEGPHGDLIIQDAEGVYENGFVIKTASALTDINYCEGLKESDLVQADMVKVNDIENGPCPGVVAFYFQKESAIIPTPCAAGTCPGHARCVNGICVCSKICDTGYTLNSTDCVCVKDTPTPTPTPCTTNFDCPGQAECEEGVCVCSLICDTGYTLDSTNCVCDENDTPTPTPTPTPCTTTFDCPGEAECEEGVCVCSLTCSTGYTLNETSCACVCTKTCDTGYTLDSINCVCVEDDTPTPTPCVNDNDCGTYEICPSRACVHCLLQYYDDVSDIPERCCVFKIKMNNLWIRTYFEWDASEHVCACMGSFRWNKERQVCEADCAGGSGCPEGTRACFCGGVNCVSKNEPCPCPENQISCSGEGDDCVTGNCCFDTDCTGGKTCQNHTCTCPTGQKPCNDTCISATSCCTNSDCAGGSCNSFHICECPPGKKSCHGTCIDDTGCCENTDCGSGNCNSSHICDCAPGQKLCNYTCIDESETCPEPIHCPDGVNSNQLCCESSSLGSYIWVGGTTGCCTDTSTQVCCEAADMLWCGGSCHTRPAYGGCCNGTVYNGGQECCNGSVVTLGTTMACCRDSNNNAVGPYDTTTQVCCNGQVKTGSSCSCPSGQIEDQAGVCCDPSDYAAADDVCCSPGTICDGHCTAAECCHDGDLCANGKICQGGFCVSECSTASDCDECFTCENNQCVCSGSICSDGYCECHAACCDDEILPGGYICIDGMGREPSGCSEGETSTFCRSNVCVTGKWVCHNNQWTAAT